MPNKRDEEEFVMVEGAIPCRIKPSKKTLKKIEECAQTYSCHTFHQELFEQEKQLYLYLQLTWRKEDFEEKLLQRFNEALIKICRDSKEFLLD
jgi:hypothetical protein